MNFKEAAKISAYLSKDYAEKIFRLIMAYEDISASEAASRLGIHIRTVQDFLETMAEFGIIEKKEVYEKKRPYFRYSIMKKNIVINIDLEKEFSSLSDNPSDFLIKEARDTGAKFSMARSGEYFSTVTLWIGEGRTSKERKINLTSAQGKFLYYLPFPDALPMSIDEIMEKADISEINRNEILDIVKELQSLKVIEKTS